MPDGVEIHIHPSTYLRNVASIKVRGAFDCRVMVIDQEFSSPLSDKENTDNYLVMPYYMLADY